MPVNLNKTLEPNKKLPIELWLRSPDSQGSVELRMLLVYFGVGEKRHRVLRITLRLKIVSGLQISATLTSRPDENGLTAITCISAANHHVSCLSLCTLVLASKEHALESSPCYDDQGNCLFWFKLFFVNFFFGVDLNVNHSEKCYLVYRVSCGNEINSNVSSIKFNASEDLLSNAVIQLLVSLSTMRRIILGLLWQVSFLFNFFSS